MPDSLLIYYQVFLCARDREDEDRYLEESNGASSGPWALAAQIRSRPSLAAETLVGPYQAHSAPVAEIHYRPFPVAGTLVDPNPAHSALVAEIHYRPSPVAETLVDPNPARSALAAEIPVYSVQNVGS